MTPTDPIPTDAEIRALFANLRGTVAAWDRLELDALETARRARAGTTAVDGHKTSHALAGPSSGSTWLVENEAGDLEAVAVTSVEANALRVPEQDPYGAIARLAFELLTTAARAARGYRNTQAKATAMVYTPERFSTCCEPGCREAAVKAGRCAADYQRKYRYERAHPGELAPPLTPAELDARTPRRRRRREAPS